METGTAYKQQRLHGGAYFSELVENLPETPASVVELLKLSRGQVELFATIQRRLLNGLRPPLRWSSAAPADDPTQNIRRNYTPAASSSSASCSACIRSPSGTWLKESIFRSPHSYLTTFSGLELADDSATVTDLRVRDSMRPRRTRICPFR